MAGQYVRKILPYLIGAEKLGTDAAKGAKSMYESGKKMGADGIKWIEANPKSGAALAGGAGVGLGALLAGDGEDDGDMQRFEEMLAQARRQRQMQGMY